MKHFTDDDLILHYYGDAAAPDGIDEHLVTCRECAAAYQSIAGTLASLPPMTSPDPGDNFWSGVYQQVTTGAFTTRARAGSALAAAILVWLVSLAYPFSVRALFYSGQLLHTNFAVGLPLFLFSLIWAFSGPFVALVALDRIRGGSLESMSHRLVVYGAVVATISPALFNLTSRTEFDLPAWYTAIGVLALAALIPVPGGAPSSRHIQKAHRWSAVLILAFAAAHIGNHLLAFVNVQTHSYALELLRSVYRRPIVEILLFSAILFQIGTGGFLVWRAQAKRPSLSMNIQALSGLYMAMFFVAHVSAALLARSATDTNFVWAAGPHGLLARPGLTPLLPYYLFGVAALFAHTRHFLRDRVARLVPDVSSQTLSYAATVFAVLVVLTIGLALCGINVMTMVASRNDSRATSISELHTE